MTLYATPAWPQAPTIIRGMAQHSQAADRLAEAVRGLAGTGPTNMVEQLRGQPLWADPEVQALVRDVYERKLDIVEVGRVYPELAAVLPAIQELPQWQVGLPAWDANPYAAQRLAEGCTVGQTLSRLVETIAELSAAGDAGLPELGARVLPDGRVTFSVAAPNAARMELWVYSQPIGGEPVGRTVLEKGDDGVFRGSYLATELSQGGVDGGLYYGYRAWGPNWEYRDEWTPGSDVGRIADVDGAGHRFNPNKLLLDPYALEISHTPLTPGHTDLTVYLSGPEHGTKDSGPVAPKGVVIMPNRAPGFPQRPMRPFKDEVIYEAHVRGLTMNDPAIPEELRGTYAGAALKAQELADLGITAIEFLPVQSYPNEVNGMLGDGTDEANYWGYMPLNPFAPSRYLAANKAPGGPTREFQDMVRAFHNVGIKVYTDQVYNHTAEDNLFDASGARDNSRAEGPVGLTYSLRGLDNATYYQLGERPEGYQSNSGVGANPDFTQPLVRDLVMSSKRYFTEVLGVDGVRDDLAAVLGNRGGAGQMEFDADDPDNVLNRAARELPARPEEGGAGVDLIAEPWGVGEGTYQVGSFPWGWAEWNGPYRDAVRLQQNKVGYIHITPATLASRIAGSPDLFGGNGRKPWSSVNFLVAHDGFTLFDLYRFNLKNNDQGWPYGPSPGGTDENFSWDQGGDPVLQRQAARTGMAILMLSPGGVPMITAGDEILRSVNGNNNPFNVDSEANWIDWGSGGTPEASAFRTFTRNVIAFRRAHPAMRAADWFNGEPVAGTPLQGGGDLKDITWIRPDGVEADAGYMEDENNHFLGWRVNGSPSGDEAGSILVAYNGGPERTTFTLPPNREGMRWYRVGDTAPWAEQSEASFRPAGAEELLDGTTYDMAERSVLVLIER